MSGGSQCTKNDLLDALLGQRALELVITEQKLASEFTCYAVHPILAQAHTVCSLNALSEDAHDLNDALDEACALGWLFALPCSALTHDIAHLGGCSLTLCMRTLQVALVTSISLPASSLNLGAPTTPTLRL